MDSAGNVYVADYSNNRIQKFSLVTPPVANFTANVTSGKVPLFVQFNDTSSGSPANWAWTFGDGQKSTEQNPVIRFDIPGVHDVSLEATNYTVGTTLNRAGYITVNSSPVITDLSPSEGTHGDTSSLTLTLTGTGFFNQLSSNALVVLTAPNNSVVTLTDAHVGKGSAHFVFPFLTAEPGTWQVQVKNGDGQLSNQWPLTVHDGAVVPLFTTNKMSGTNPLTVQFTNNSTGYVRSFSWNFGDGSPDNTMESNPSHTFTTPGNFTVNLTVFNNNNTAGVNASTTIHVIPVPAIIGCQPASGQAGTQTTLHISGQDFVNTGNLLRVNLTKSGEQNITGTVGSVTLTGIDCTFTIPADAKPGDWTLVVTNADGTEANWAGTFKILSSPPAPTITAGFYAFGHVGQAPYSVRFLDQSAGSPTAWKWDFGDGSTSTEQNPTHIYNQTGAYNVALTASSGWGSDTSIQYRCVIVNTVPAANFTANTTAGGTPFTVQFTDQSTGATGYQWQFGDGQTSTEQNPVHTYTHPGSYTVTLVASEPDYGSVYLQKPGYITVTDPPTVGFSANVTAGLTPLAVQFNESTAGSVPYFYWLFGDGSTSFDRNPVHIYDTAGRYSVSLYAFDSNGYQVKTVENYINVTSRVTPTPDVTATSTITPVPTATVSLPEANFTITPQGGQDSMQILINDTAVNATSVWYDLGDGTTTAYRTFRYTYWQAGTYTIRQTATSTAGSSTKTLSVTVPSSVPVTTQTVAPTVTATATATAPATVAPTVTAGIPYNGPHTIPGLLQAEDYDLGGEGVAYHDTTPGNAGGAYRHDDVDIEVLDTDGSPNIGWIRAGEWLAYTVNVSTAGTYDAGFRVASSHPGSSVQVYVDDGTKPVATVNVPNTGDWPVFQTVSAPVTLPAGQHRLKLAFPTDYVNVNWITFTLRGGV